MGSKELVASLEAEGSSDLHAPQEEKLARSGVLKDVDVYQANHHGSHTSTSQALMDALQPEVVVISNGTNGLYKHPRNGRGLAKAGRRCKIPVPGRGYWAKSRARKRVGRRPPLPELPPGQAEEILVWVPE